MPVRIPGSLLAVSRFMPRGMAGWRPRWRLAEAIARTARWYRRFHDGAPAADLRALIADDIAAFTA